MCDNLFEFLWLLDNSVGSWWLDFCLCFFLNQSMHQSSVSTRISSLEKCLCQTYNIYKSTNSPPTIAHSKLSKPTATNNVKNVDAVSITGEHHVVHPSTLSDLTHRLFSKYIKQENLSEIGSCLGLGLWQWMGMIYFNSCNLFLEDRQIIGPRLNIVL